MKISVKSLTRFVVGMIVGIGAVCLLLPQSGWTQTASDANPLQDFDSENNSDPFSAKNDDASSGVFDLIHRAQMGNIRPLDEYSAEQNENLDAAATQFRQLQMKRLEGQQQVTPANSVNTR